MPYKIAVAGAVKYGHCSKNICKLAEEIGREIARQKCVLVTGATVGLPYSAAKGFKSVGGLSIGFSPAGSEIEHLRKYHLPVDLFDVIVYTGFHYSGRNLLMTNAADGIIVICGRMGTLNEFTTALEDKKPIAVLKGSGGAADKIPEFLEDFNIKSNKVLFEKEPRQLVRKLIEMITKEKKRLARR